MPGTGPIIAGVFPGQPVVVRRAAELAASLGVKLVCAYVDISSYSASDSNEPAELRLIDPDGVYDDDEVTDGMKQNLSRTLAIYGIEWSFQIVSGEPARALGRLGEHIDASMIVVGTREHGFTHRLEELVVGSVAVHLTHHQHRPVLVVPLNPQPSEGRR
ncbi:universal stress protein [Arthrobacter sp. H14]|uniref:universal stress protein n=1 Tax=Arthrobacter sp. H14 TaxID=1312959 RepID=UPI0004B74172|nr:universal stress protein [Arthrobacter sp. H14]